MQIELLILMLGLKFDMFTCFEIVCRFLRQISSDNNGFARRITNQGSAASQIKDVFDEVSHPLLTNIAINFPPGQVNDTSLVRTGQSTYYDGDEVREAAGHSTYYDGDEVSEAAGHSTYYDGDEVREAAGHSTYYDGDEVREAAGHITYYDGDEVREAAGHRTY